MKRGLIVLLILTLSLLVGGCWNRIELNRLGIISAMAFDMDENNQWILTFQIIIPQSSQGKSGRGGSQSPITVYSTKGKTILEAVQKSELEAPRRPFFSHARVVIISQRVAKYGIDQILDYHLRSNQERENVDVLISNGAAKNVLEVLTPLETIPGEAITNLVSEQLDGQSNLALSKMYELISIVANPTASATLQEIKIAGAHEGQASLKSLQETRSPAAIKVDRVGVFKQDKFTGWLSWKESQGVPWITNRLHRTTVVFSCKGENRIKQLSTFLVDKSDTQLKPRISDGHLFMTVDINVKGNLMETSCDLDLKKSAVLSKLEEYIEEQIKADVEKSFQALKGMKADALGFGDAFHRQYPQAWKKLSKNWGAEFDKVRMDVNVKVTIRRTGMINDSFSKISGKKE
ncbi:Ger(x)C family spore germination protein [Paenibacillus sp. sptzw28]|uniref:Ger(x)C family spore germination protein n=1 Tax=Paenibacillus sp. sptzw28 TaxID=715179 RepID=UPI001C6E1F14|nr:Ger(x)C family spore germination protein [Paenibacillus sp. sptzw28]QYR22371.1 Ger(x)C family spore germination protein [Paenibacillus sp. sptzw28]